MHWRYSLTDTRISVSELIPLLIIAGVTFVILLTLFFILRYKILGKANPQRQNFILRIIFGQKFFIALISGGMALIGYQAGPLFSGGWGVLLKDIAFLLVLSSLFFTFGILLHLLRHFVRIVFSKSDDVKRAYRQLENTLATAVFFTFILVFIFHQQSLELNFRENPLWHIIFFGVTVALLAVSTGALTNFISEIYLFYQNSKPARASAVKAINWPFRLVFAAAVCRLALLSFNFGEKAAGAVHIIIFAFIMIAAAYFLTSVIEMISLWLKEIVAQDVVTDTSLVELIAMILKVVIVCIAVLLIIQRITGQQLKGILATLGIGGVAVALASQDLLKNLLGGITVMLDKPFKVGQYVTFTDYTGAIEKIGFRSTHIRTFEGTLIVVPNSSIATTPVQNIAVRSFIKRTFTINLRNDTPADKVNEAVKLIQNLLDEKAAQLSAPAGHQVVFRNFSDWAFMIEIGYSFINSTDLVAGADFDHNINIEILKKLEAAGIKLAVPHQSIALEEPISKET
jgi:MscS family membrane protein